ncbi:hypothetical protein MATL_G00141630 [Megalops atlanticus]|uniref:Agouti-related protein n=1 Tax=Megalops atlanticus TaxID=7932 RepID=A0A9D3PWK4_MEGAT|nr:hypothetical protein MATL_G00141630 [Megalops atlanticus]
MGSAAKDHVSTDYSLREPYKRGHLCPSVREALGQDSRGQQHKIYGAVHGNARLEETQPHLLRTVEELSFLSDIGKGSLSTLHPERFVTNSEELLMDDAVLSNEEENVSEAIPLQRRAVRSPRRCFRHQESCLGHQLPCCDPCDTCYCRFFNAICYCRRIGQACSHARP